MRQNYVGHILRKSYRLLSQIATIAIMQNAIFVKRPIILSTFYSKNELICTMEVCYNYNRRNRENAEKEKSREKNINIHFH
jgi:hypothetical protein